MKAYVSPVPCRFTPIIYLCLALSGAVALGLSVWQTVRLTSHLASDRPLSPASPAGDPALEPGHAAQRGAGGTLSHADPSLSATNRFQTGTNSQPSPPGPLSKSSVPG